MTQQTEGKEADGPQYGKLFPVCDLVLHLVAEGISATAILGRVDVAEAIGRGETTSEWVHEVSSTLRCPVWAKAIIAELRKALLEGMDTIPIRHRAYRLRRLQQILDSPEATPQDQLQALIVAHEQSRDKFRPSPPAVGGEGKRAHTAQG